MLYNSQENPLLSNSRLTSNRRADLPEIEQFTTFTPWEVDENLEFSPSYYPSKSEEKKKKQNRPQTSKALYFPNLVSGIESYTKNSSSPRSSRNLIQKAPENKLRVPENLKNKKRSITSASNSTIRNAVGASLNMYQFPVKRKTSNQQKNSQYGEGNSMVLDSSSTAEERDDKIKELSNTMPNQPASREKFQSQSQLIEKQQVNPGKLRKHLQGVFEKDKDIARGYAIKPKTLNLSTKGTEMKSETENSEYLKEAMSSLREIANDYMREENVENETNKENLTGSEFKSQSFVETTDEEFRPLNGKAHISRRSQTGFKSVDITNQQIRHVKTVEEEALLTNDNTPRGYHVKSRKIVVGPPRTPLSNTILTSQNIKMEQKFIPFNKNKTIRSGSQTKQRIDYSEDRKNFILGLGLEIKSNEYATTQQAVNTVTKRTRAPLNSFQANISLVPNPNQNQTQERSIIINNYIPSMLDCYKKNKRKYLVSPSKLNHQMKEAFHNYYDTSAHTPLVRTLRRINGKCQYDKHILNYLNEVNEPVSTDTDEKVLSHFLNKSHKPKINLPSRKTKNQTDKSDLINRFINQTMSNMPAGGVTASKIKTNEDRSVVIEKSPERLVSWTGKRKLKPAVEIQNFILRK